QGNRYLVSSTPDRVEKAWASFDKAIHLDPKFAPAYIGIFQVRLAQGTGSWSAGAVSNLHEAEMKLIEIAPSLAEAQSAAACIKFRAGRMADALADASRATHMRLGSKDDCGFVHTIYGWLLMNAGETDKA